MNIETKHWASITAGILSLAGHAAASSEKYTYDTSGNIVEKSIGDQVTQMTYDSSNRLTERQATGRSKETTAYDGAGRPITLKGEAGQQTRSMIYGYGDKVLETKNHGASTGFYYNAEGQMVGKKTDSSVTPYTWDGNVLAAEGNQAFTNEAHVTGGIPLLQSGNKVIISDYLGNTIALGEKCLASTAYGEGLEDGRFTGKPFVKELESYVFLHRLYSPSSVRWTFPDPSGFPDGANNSLYVNNDPISSIDSLGLAKKGPIDNDYTCNASVNNAGGSGSVDMTFTIVTHFSSHDGVSTLMAPGATDPTHAFNSGPTIVYDTGDQATATSSHYKHTYSVTCKKNGITLNGSYLTPIKTIECEK